MRPAKKDELSLFLADAREIVERLHRDLEELRRERSHGRRRRELAARLFRRVHTLKGSAGSLGYKSVSLVCHELEGVLDGVRLGRIEISSSLLDTFEDAVDEIAQELQGPPGSGAHPLVGAMVERLRELAVTGQPPRVGSGSLRSVLPVDIARALSEYDLQHAREAIREGARLFIVSADFAIETFDQSYRDLSKLLGQTGEIISTVPGAPATAEEINFRLLYATELISVDLMRQAESLGRIEATEIEINPAIAKAEIAAESGSRLMRPPDSGLSAPVRVELWQIDELISAVSELFQYTTSNVVGMSSAAGKQAVETTIANLRPRFLELEDRLIRLRLVPAGEILERAATRAGRIAARQLNKEVEFEITGSDVGLEKSLAEVIADPLFHLVRNAVSHGIETPAERTAAGKSPVGRVSLAAFNEGSRIHITVTDDGRGVVPERIVSAATEHGIVNNGGGLSLDQCLRLIFRPGFSTSAEISELSGRGIGLDIVDRAMELSGGEVRVATEAGAGTTFAMIMPAALALVNCLIVRSGDQLYALESSRVHAGAKTHEADYDESLPFFSLRRLLGQSESQRDEEGAFVVWQAPDHVTARSNDDERYFLVIDSIVGEQETLVRTLGRHAPRWAGVCGAAELFDGNVALVLDIEELIKVRTVY
jgi:two-component system, chemotaxis family, sensor kinase CheA